MSEPFTPKYLEEEKDINDIKISVRITEDDKTWLEHAKRILQQPKTSTALKQFAKIGYEFVLHDKKTMETLNTVVANFRRNQRTGITESEYKI